MKFARPSIVSLCLAGLLAGAVEISRHGGWRAYLAAERPGADKS